MEILGAGLMIIGAIVGFAGGIWFLVTAFRTGILWGLGTLLLPFVGLVFLIMYFREASKPFFLSLLGNGVLIIGSLLIPHAS